MPESMQFSIEGIPGVLEGLRRMSERVEKRAAKRAVTAAAKPIVAAAEINLQSEGAVRTRALLRSLGTVVRTYQRGQITVAVFGPRKGFDTTFRGRRHIPSKIGHLVERGHKASGWHREMGGQFVAAKPFLRPAMDQNRAGSQVIFASVIRAEIQAASRG